MPFVPVPNTALVEVRMQANAQQVENTLWFTFPDPPDADALATLCAQIRTWWVTFIAPLTSSAVQLREIQATSMHSATAPTAALSPATLTIGGSTPNIVSNNVTMAVSFRTASRGRSFRGRNYIVGLTEDQVAGNQVVAGITTLWLAAYEHLLGSAATPGSIWVVASRFSGVSGPEHTPVPRAAGIVTEVTSVVVVDDNVDSARRRLTGRGR
jgi:hypothetical protein